MASSVIWTTDPVTAWMPNFRNYVRDITEVVEDVVAARADEIRDWMKQNAIWQDRTGLARRELDTQLIRDGFSVILVMYQGANVFERRANGDKWYAPYLEKWMQSGRYGILAPALDHWGVILLDDIRRALK